MRLPARSARAAWGRNNAGGEERRSWLLRFLEIPLNKESYDVRFQLRETSGKSGATITNVVTKSASPIAPITTFHVLRC
jgi:hypothetical protein